LSSISLALRLATSWLNPGLPSYLIYFVTARCNAKCESCFYWKETETAGERSELTPEETKKIAEKLPRLVQLTLSGGEPFLREDLFDLVSPIIEKSRPGFLSIPSNGIMTDRIIKTSQLLLSRYPWLRVNIELSLDGIGKTHDRIRGRTGAFEELTKTWRELKTLQDKHPRLRLGILTVLSALNQEGIFEILEFIKRELKPDRQEVLFARGNPRNPDAIKVPIERFQEVAAWLDKESPSPKSFMDRVRRELARQKRELIVETVSRNRMVMPCLAGSKLIVMEPDGRIRPCEMLETLHPSPPSTLGLENFFMGELRKSNYDLEEILKNDASKKIRDFIERSSCRCSYECAALADLAFRPSSVFKIFLKALI